MGDFVNLLTELADSSSFQRVVRIPKQRMLDGTPQDYVLRFFAFHDRYKSFDHSVKDFLNGYCKDAALQPRLVDRRDLFQRTFDFLADHFRDGIRRKRAGTTPVNLYEGIAVGAALALDAAPNLQPPGSTEWVDLAELRELTTGATNDRRRVLGRIEFCRAVFLNER